MSVTTIPQPVMLVLANAVCEGNTLVLQGSLDRSLYTATNKVLEQLGAKWNTKAKAHLFPTDMLAEDRLHQVLMTGTIDKPLKLGYFPTPDALVDAMVYKAGLTDESVVLEPSAGDGSIIRGVRRVSSMCVVHAIELQDQFTLKIYQAGANFSHFCNFLDFNEHKLPYSHVLMNPPFEKQADIDHVTHALEFLPVGGVLVSIMSASVKWRDNAKTVAFRSLVDYHGGEFTDLPSNSFKESGTLVNTVMLYLVKK